MVIVVLVISGLCFGSFVNALVWRLHEQSKKSQKSKVKSQKYSIVHGRSMCPDCQHGLAWYDLLPVISWLSLAGKCRYCRQSIAWQYPIVELSTAVLFVISYVFWPSNFNLLSSDFLFALWLTFLTGFMALTIYDLKWMILPNRIIFPLQALALVYAMVVIITTTGSKANLIISTILSVGCSAGLFFVIFQVSHGKWIGGGDVKLAVILGLILGSPVQAFLMLFIASFMGSVVGLPLMLLGKAKRNTKLPFGPFLIGATLLVYLFGASILGWYKTHILLV